MKRLALSVLLALASCDGGSDPTTEADSGDGDGTATDAAPSCDEQPVVTYDTFGRGFLATYCDGCHGSQVVDDARQGAPPQVVFDDRAGAANYGDRILARVAPPDGSAPTMPPVGGVTPDDRERVVVWLTCFPE